MSNFAEACRLSYEDWVLTLPNPDDFPDPQYSKRHIKRMEKLFDQMRGDTYHRFTRKTVRVMLVAAVIFALMLSAFVIPSSREFLLKEFDIFGVYSITEHNNNSINGEIEVGYIPEGYELVEVVSFDKFITNYYESQDSKTFFISKRSSSIGIIFDTESGIVENIIHNGIEYSYYTSDYGYLGIIWNENDYIYQIDGQLSKEELLKIAKNVK